MHSPPPPRRCAGRRCGRKRRLLSLAVRVYCNAYLAHAFVSTRIYRAPFTGVFFRRCSPHKFTPFFANTALPCDAYACAWNRGTAPVVPLPLTRHSAVGGRAEDRSRSWRLPRWPYASTLLPPCHRLIAGDAPQRVPSWGSLLFATRRCWLRSHEQWNGGKMHTRCYSGRHGRRGVNRRAGLRGRDALARCAPLPHKKGDSARLCDAQCTAWRCRGTDDILAFARLHSTRALASAAAVCCVNGGHSLRGAFHALPFARRRICAPY